MQVRLAANRHVVGHPARRAQGLHALDLQARKVGGSCAHRIHNAAQCRGEQQRLFPLGGCEVAITAGQSQARLITLGFPADHLNGQGKLLDHVAYHHQLLVILLAEQRGAGLGHGEEFHDHGAHADEKAGPEVSLQNIGQLGGRVHLEGLGLRIQLGLPGRKHNVAARRLELLAIGFQGAGVGVKVFVRGKLQPVHEDGGNRDIAQRLGLPHQREVPGMEVAHRGHHGGVTVRFQRLAQLRNRVNQLHERRDVTMRGWRRPESCRP